MPCPDAQQLESLLRARVTPQEEAELAVHVEGCIECRKRLEALAGGADFVPPPRATKTARQPLAPMPGLVHVMDKLRQTWPWRRGRRLLSIPTPSATARAPEEFRCEIKAPSPPEPSSTDPPVRPSRGQTLQTPWWHSRLAGTAFCALFGLLFLAVNPLGSWLRCWSYDLPFALRGPIQPDGVLIVSMDADLQRKLNPEHTNQWSRALHAKAVQKALALGAEMIVFDIIFTRPGDDPAATQEFVEAILAASGKVVLGGQLDVRVEGGTEQSVPRPSIPSFETVASRGLADLPVDRDGRLRRHADNPHAFQESLAWKAANHLGKAPADPSRPRWINYYGPRGTLPRISYDRFLEQPATETNVLAGQILFVGWNPAKPGVIDEHDTPYTRGNGETMTGVEIHATAFLNLIRGESLEELPRMLELGLIMGIGFILVAGFSWLRPGWALACSGVGFVLLALGACLMMWFNHRWFPWLIVGAVQMPCALAWSVAARRHRWPREKRSLRRGLAGVREPVQGSTIQDSRPGPAAVEPRRFPEIPDHAPLRCVGRGAYGEVWLARDIIGSFHAVKVVYRNTFTHDEPFEREFRGIQKFTPISRLHPGWVHVLHVGRNDAQGYFYYIMELGDDEVTGQKIDSDCYVPKNLAGELRKRGRLPLEECLSLGLALADALEHLHQHALIHRDIKPSNVIFVRNAPKFTDIGLVTDISSRREASWIGTEGYMAPEGPGTPAADVFGLGKLIYETATGRDREAFPEMHTALSKQPTRTEWQQFQQILLKACAENPANRYASAAQLHRDLLQLLNAIDAGRLNER